MSVGPPTVIQLTRSDLCHVYGLVLSRSRARYSLILYLQIKREPNLVRFVGVEKVQDVDVAEDVAGDKMEGTQGDSETTLLDLARDSFFAAVNHRISGALHRACAVHEARLRIQKYKLIA